MVEFNPLNISEELKKLYKDFILTSFPIKNESIKNKLEKAIDDEKMLWNGPYISVASKYKKGSNIKVFLENMGLDKTIIDTIKIDKLFKHQEDAISSIMNNNHTIVSTGTGSGKTESFLFPIIDHCIKNKNKGLKAIIVYPMNALANDQMLRLRTLLYQINSNLDDPIRIAKYTGQTPSKSSDNDLNKIPLQKCKIDKSIFGTVDITGCPQDCDQIQLKAGKVDNNARYLCKNNKNYVNDFELITREEIRNDPPDILITNYVQLEYLLLRREDSRLFSSLEMKFLVFDELHYYSGATGSEVALLIRRLKSRIRKYTNEDLVCIGTSATISSSDNAKLDISKFASTIFGEDISLENIILGEKDKKEFTGDYLPNDILPIPIFSPQEIIEMDQMQFKDYCSHFSNEKIDNLEGESRKALLGSLLIKNKIFKFIADSISSSTQSIENIMEEFVLIFGSFNVDKSQIEDLIWSYLYTGSIAFDPESFQESENDFLIRSQLHIFFKTIGENWPFGEIFVCSDCGEVFAGVQEKCVNCDGVVEELAICRFCGEEFFRAIFDSNPLDSSSGARSCIGLDTTSDCKRISYDAEDMFQVFQSYKNHENFTKQNKCLNCGSLISETKSECSFCHSDELKEVYISKKFNRCPSCGRSYGKMSAVSGIYMSPNATSKVVFDLNYILMPDKDRKMIVFSDSRQDASYMAGTIRDQHLDHLMRQVVAQTVQKEKEIDYSELEENVLFIFQKMYSEMEEEEIRRALLSEISSQRGRQRSTENLGLVNIDYSRINKLNIDEICSGYNIPKEDYLKYLISILDLIRQAGAIEGLHNFKLGKYLFPTGFVCERDFEKRNNIKNMLSNYPRYKNRFTAFTAKVFDGLDVISLVETSFKFLKDNRYLKEVNIGPPYVKNPPSGFVINRKKLVFKKPFELFECDECGRLFTHNLKNQCSGWYCNGNLVEKDINEYYNSDDFYLEFYKEMEPVRLEVNEDTGYISIEERQKRELAFRNGDIDLLVATPTLELGIDIGDLSCVGLMKSPPSPASYVQRVGRAGRSSKISLANAFMFQNPIDLYYFENPQELISGNVLAPVINIENSYILERHIHSLILEELLVSPSEKPSFYERDVEKFIEEECADDLISQLENNNELITSEIESTFAIDNMGDYIDHAVKSFEESFVNSINDYNRELKLLENILDEIEIQKRQNRRSKSEEQRKDRYRLIRMEFNINDRLDDLSRRDLFSQLSKEGFIPRYAFPGSAVRIISQDGKEYAERQMPIALYELSPGMPVYLNGMKYRVEGLPFAQEPEMIKTTSFFICGNCGIYAREGLDFNTCRECGESNSSKELKECYKPSAVVIKEQGRPGADGRDPVFTSSDVYLMENNQVDGIDFSKDSIIGQIKLFEKKSILSVVSEIRDQSKNSPEKFNLCKTCGYFLGGDFSVEENSKKNHLDILGRNSHQPSEILRDVNLYHKFDTSALMLNLPFDDEETVITFKNAIINASQRIVGADDGEIDGIIKEHSLILYDNVEGGAGYVNTIYDLFDKVIDETINLILTCKCQKGCLKCLYSYRRRFEIPKIDKRKILPFSKNILYRKSLSELNNSKSFFQDNESKRILEKFGIPDKEELYSKITIIENINTLKNLILSSKKTFIGSPSIVDVDIEWDANKRSSWIDILSYAKVNGTEELTVWINNNNEEPHFADKLKKWGIKIYFIDDYASKMGKEYTFILIQNVFEEYFLLLSNCDLSYDMNNEICYCVFLNDDRLFTSLPNYLGVD
jgi:ATP-dependent helicase YprA (DUF1998 family)